jgi:hypothetical protein
MLRMFTIVLNTHPALAANPVYNFKLPMDAQLVAVSTCNSTANAGTIKIGKSTDDDAYLASLAIGVSGTPVLTVLPAGFDGADAGGQFPHIAAGTNIMVTITDGGSHPANVCVILFFTEG